MALRAPTKRLRPAARLRQALVRVVGPGDGVLERERALRQAIAALVGAPDRDAVLDAGLAAVADLLGPGARAVIAVPGEHGIVLRGEELPGATLRLPLRGSKPQGVLAIEVGKLDAASRAALGELADCLAAALERVGLAATAARRDSDAWYRSLIENSSDAVLVLDADGTIRYATPSIEPALGWAPEALLGTALLERVHPDDQAWARTRLGAAARPGRAEEPMLIRWRHRDDSVRSLEIKRNNLLDDPAVGGVVLNARDVTDRVRLEEQLTRRAFDDGLTGLANRSLFADRLEHALHGGAPGDGRLAVLFLDLDDFRKVNDSLGHAAGDELLRACARRLTDRLGAGDTAARLGGDEFAVLLESCPSPEAAGQMAHYLLDALAEPYDLVGQRVTVSASAGVAVVSRREPPPAEEVLRNAGIALYRAKDEGPSRYRFYEERMHAAAVRRVELETELRIGIAMRQMIAHYQPIVDMEDGRVLGAEALMRWQHPERGLLHPGQFVPLAEQAGLIELLGGQILRTAVRQAAEWRRDGVGGGDLWVSVNLSVDQLANPAFVGEVELALKDFGLPPQLLVLELTESAVMRDVVAATHRLDSLKRLGVRIAVDDFGEGHSSLTYLASLPLDLLKIPKAFVDPLGQPHANTALVRAITELARSLDLRTVAEGIEQPEQLAALRQLGCDLAQGYLFARPADAARVAAMADGDRLSRRRGAAAPLAATRAS